MGFNELHGVSGSFIEFQGVSGSFKEFQGVSRSFNVFLGVSRSFMEFQGVSRRFVLNHRSFRVWWRTCLQIFKNYLFIIISKRGNNWFNKNCRPPPKKQIDLKQQKIFNLNQNGEIVDFEIFQKNCPPTPNKKLTLFIQTGRKSTTNKFF